MPSRPTPHPDLPTWTVRVAAAVATLVGGVYLVLWLLGVPPRWSAHGVITMKANMALAQLLAGAALLALDVRPRRRVLRAAALVASGAVLAIGALTLAESLSGAELGIDQLLAVEPPGQPGTASPNRMGPPGALSLVLVGAGLVALAWQRRVAVFLGLATCAIVLVPAIGFLYRVGPLYAHPQATVISWPAIVGLFALGAGIALAYGRDDEVPLPWRDDPGGVLLRRMVVPAVLLPIFVGFVRIQGERHGLYERHVGSGLFAVSLVLVFLLLLWRSADRLSAAATERERSERRASAALRESEERYRTLFTSMAEGFAVGEVICDEAGAPCDVRFVDLNDAFEQQTGLRRQDVLSRPIRELLPRLEQGWIETYAQVALTGRPVRFESYNRNLDRHFSVFAFSPAPGRFATLFTDVTERERGSAALRRTAELLDMGDAFLELDRDWRIVRVNRNQERLSRKPASETVGRVLWEVWPEAAAPESAYWREYHRCRDERVPVQFVEHFAPLDLWTGVSAYPTRGGGIAVFFRDVSDRMRAEEALEESERRFRTLADAMPQLVWTAEPDGSVDYYNCRAAQLAGIEPRADGTWIWAPVLHPDDRPGTVAAWRRAVETGATYETEHRVQRTDGTFRWYLSRAVAARDEHGRIVKWYGTATDIHDQKEAQRVLEEADRRKDEFLGMLSHELRNPLAPIRNSLYLLDHAEPGGPQARRAKAVASRQIAHLTRLVDDLLDVTRIGRGKIQLRRTRLDLATLARRTAEDHRALMDDRGLELVVEVPGGPVLVHVDETRLAQVMGNLLQNAAKFTRAGGRVTLSVAAEGGEAVIRVRDTGAGIAPELLRSVFEPFVQAEQTLARSEGGLGLGLALVKGLVEFHGGEVVAASDGPGRGTEFVVRLPLAEGQERGAGAETADGGARGAPVRRRVLVVDDNRDAAETLAELVELFGHDAEVAFDGPTAVAKARAQRPDVVLCDIGLPGMDGYAVAKELRADGPRDVRLIAVSGYAQPEDLARAAEAGFDGHIAKPPEPAGIERVLG